MGGIEAPSPGHVRKNKESKLAVEYSIYREGQLRLAPGRGDLDVRPQSKSL